MFVFWPSEDNQSWPLKATKWILLASLEASPVPCPGGNAMVTDADMGGSAPKQGNESQREPLLLAK